MGIHTDNIAGRVDIGIYRIIRLHPDFVSLYFNCAINNSIIIKGLRLFSVKLAACRLHTHLKR